MAFTPITVTERYVYDDLTPASGKLWFTPSAPMHNGDTVVAAGRAAELDAEGDLSIALAATTDPGTTPVGVSYEVRMDIAGQPTRRFYVAVPHDAAGGTVDLGSLLTAETPPVVSYPAPGPQGPAGPAGAPGPNLLATADDLTVSGATVGQVVRVTATGPLVFDLGALAAGDVGADPAGTAAAAVAAHEAATDPHPQYLTAAEGSAAYQPADTDLTAIAGLIPADDTVLQRKAGAWTARSPAQVKTDLALVKSDVGLGSVDNVAAADLRDRATHTGAQAISTITGLQAVLDTITAVTANGQTGTTYTLVASDAGKVIELTNAAAITLTIPTNATAAIPVGTIIELYQGGAGQVTVTAAGGVTLRAPNGAKLSAQYASASLRKRATDEWVLAGSVTT